MDTFVFLVELIGTVAFAISGALMGIRKQLDLLGVLVLGMTTACCGGLIRDLLLGIHPPLLFSHSIYALVALLSSACVFFIVLWKREIGPAASGRFGSLLNVADAIGLGVFSVVGVNTTLAQQQHGLFLILSLGTITGVGGGMVRDILVGEIPFFLRKHIYCLAALSGAGVYYLLLCWLHWNVVALLSGIFVTLIIRLLAAKYEWNLPSAP